MRPESLYFLFSPITRVKGVGSQTAQALGKLLPAATAVSGASVPIIRDLLFHLPIGIVDRRFTCSLREAPDGVVATFVVTVDAHEIPKRGSKKPYKVLCSNETGDITLVFFHAKADYLKQVLPVGQKRVISGRVEHFDFRLQMTHPDIIAAPEQLSQVQTVEPTYPLTAGITSRRIAHIVKDALEKLPEFPEWIKVEGAQERTSELIGWKEALRLAHHPKNEEDLSPLAPARLRLAYDEMLANQLHLAILRSKMHKQAGAVIRGTGALTSALEKSLPFALSAGQKQVLSEIYRDMQSGHRMGRLLQGDVGSGKTIVALFAMLRAAEQGLQSALMVPTELIAEQHFYSITEWVNGGRWMVDGETNAPTTNHQPPTTILLTGSIKGEARTAALAKIKNGEAKIVIGTHALFQEHVEFNNLALVVIDEQHRFGVNQRMALSAKGDAPHILHMTATPIPRSLAMTLYGDMDISPLTEKPAGRQPITTRLIPNSRYEEVVERLKAALDRGEKAYWICPLIDDSMIGLFDDSKHDIHESTNHRIIESSDLAAARSRFAEFTARFGSIVSLVHGRMKGEDRNVEMQKFAEGKTKLLVATTVVEVGVDIKDATIMVIEQAERFGLAQLHQLRGRVGRGEKPSACVLMYGGSGDRGIGEMEYQSSLHPRIPESPTTRLSILRETNDGFKIAEADLAERGGGDIVGVRQSGMPRFIFTDLYEHRELLKKAREEAEDFVRAHPDFQNRDDTPQHLLLQLFGYL